jgi:hypothetical protein
MSLSKGVSIYEGTLGRAGESSGDRLDDLGINGVTLLDCGTCQELVARLICRCPYNENVRFDW